MRCAAVFVAAVFLAIGCGDSEPKPLNEPGERLYELNGKILSRDEGDNTLRIEHEAIPGFMEAMTMDFSVRGADVNQLPADGARVTATLHITERGYWVTGVRQLP